MIDNLPSKESLQRHHEVIEPSLRNVFISVVAVALMVGGCLTAAGLLQRHYSRNRPMQAMNNLGILLAPNHVPLTRFPAPNLELDDGHADQMALKASQSEKLNTYGWIDRSKGIVHIPIDRAMTLIASQGLPAKTNTITGSGSGLKLETDNTGGRP